MSGPGRKPSITDDKILVVFQTSPDPFLTTKEVSDQLELGRRGTYDRLTNLADDGRLKRKKVGESAVVWWSPAELKERYS